MEHSQAADDISWSSRGLRPQEALCELRSWTPVEFAAADRAAYDFQWVKRSFGPLQLLSIRASAQSVINRPGRREMRFELLQAVRTPISLRVGGRSFELPEGHFVLLDLTQDWEMTMASPHEALGLFMPERWLEHWVPDPARAVGRPFQASSWSAPLGCLLASMAQDDEPPALPRFSIAEQVGPLLALALGRQPPGIRPHKSRLNQRIRALVEARYPEPELDPARVAGALGISKRYLHSVLAENGTTFMQALRKVRIDRAAGLLADRRFAAHPIADISLKCGYLDPGHFARTFRQQFGIGPRRWRAERSRLPDL